MNRDYDIEISTAVDYFSRQDSRVATPEYIKETLEKLAKPMRDYHREVATGSRSGHLTEAGIHDLKVRAAQKARAELTAHQKDLSILDRRIFDLRTSMKAKPKDLEGQLVSFLRQREIRDNLRGMDSLQVKAVYLDAVSHEGFDEVADAIESAPAIPGRGPMLSKNDLEEGRQIRLRRENQETAKTIDGLNMVKNILNGFLRPSFKELEEVLGSADDEAVLKTI